MEEWIAPFKNDSIIFPENTTEFRQKYESWIHEQFQQQGIQEERKYRLSPRLVVVDDKKKEFFIGVALEVFDGKKIETLIF